MKENSISHVKLWKSNIISSSAENVKDYFLTLVVYITNLNDDLLQLSHLEFIKDQFGLSVFGWQIGVVHVSLFTFVLGEGK